LHSHTGRSTSGVVEKAVLECIKVAFRAAAGQEMVKPQD
jgi:hypothetical protein